MRRREFVGLVGGIVGVAARARAQQPARVPVVGFLRGGTSAGAATMLAAFRKGLSETGFVEGRNLTIEFRWGLDSRDRQAEAAADMVRRKVDVIVAPGFSVAALAAKALTTTIPIVFTTSGDPVQLGLVASLNRPGGNVTGFTDMSSEIVPKQFGLLHELLPRATRFWRAHHTELSLLRSNEHRREVGGCGLRRARRNPSHQHRTRYRRSLCGTCAKAHRRFRRARRRASVWPTVANPHARCAPRNARNLFLSRLGRCRWADELRAARNRSRAPSRYLCRPHPQGRKARRPPGGTLDQVRIGSSIWQPRGRSASRSRRTLLSISDEVIE